MSAKPPPRSPLEWVVFAVIAVIGGAVVVALAGTLMAGDDDQRPSLGAPAVNRPTASALTTVAGPPTTVPFFERSCPGVARYVTYEAEGSRTSSGSVTMAMPDGTQQADVRLPMKNDAGREGLRFCAVPGEFVYIAVQNQKDSGAVTCRITVDGQQVAEITSSGAYVIATCDGSVP